MTWFKFKSTKNEKLIKDLTTEISLLRNELTVHKDGHAPSANEIDNWSGAFSERIEVAEKSIDNFRFDFKIVGVIKEEVDELRGLINKVNEATIKTFEDFEKSGKGYELAFDSVQKKLDELSEKIESLSERTGKNELMFTAVFKKTQDTYSRGMRGLISQSAKCSMYAAKLAEEKVAEIEVKHQKVFDDIRSYGLKGLPMPSDNKPTKIIVNTREFDINTPEVSYDDIVEIAVLHSKNLTMEDPSEILWTVTYYPNDNSSGTKILKKGETVSVTSGMVFSVYKTLNS